MERLFVLIHLFLAISVTWFSQAELMAKPVELNGNKLAIVHAHENPAELLMAAGIVSNDQQQWLLQDTHLILIGNIIATEGDINRNLTNLSKFQALARQVGSDITILKSGHITKFEMYMSDEQRLLVKSFPEVVRWGGQLITNGGISLTAAKTGLEPGMGQDNWSTDIHSPMNYMGNQICHPVFESSRLKEALGLLKANTVWAARSENVPEAGWQKRLNDQLHLLGEGSVAYLDLDANVSVMYQNQTVSFIQAPDRYPANPVGLSEDAIIEILTKGDVVNSEIIPVGITKPVRLTLRHNDREIDAIFKSVDNHPKQERGKWKQSRNIIDRFGYEVAAFKVDRLLGLGLVPVVIERTIDNKKGALQVWYDGLISKLGYRDKGMSYQGHCDRKAQRGMMHTFDFLLRNEDRNQSNILHNETDWQVWFIDHSRSFGLKTDRHSTQEKSKFEVTEEFRQRLQAVSREQLNELRPWLHKRQIRSLDKRRRNLIEDNF